MKKKNELILNIILIAVLAVLVVFLLIKAENKLEKIVDILCYAGGFILLRYGLNLMLPKSDDGNKKRLTWKKLFLFDAILVIIGVVLAILILFNVISISGQIWTVYLCFSYLFILILSIGNTCIMTVNAFKKKYIYTKKTLEIEDKAIDVDVFTVVNYKGNIVRVEVEGEINGEKVTTKGFDEAKATEKFEVLYRNE